jgi:hypothetical protein
MSLTIKVRKQSGLYVPDYGSIAGKKGEKVRWEIEPRTDVLEVEWPVGASPFGTVSVIATSNGRSAEYELSGVDGKYPFTCKVNGVPQPGYSGGTVEILHAD